MSPPDCGEDGQGKGERHKHMELLSCRIPAQKRPERSSQLSFRLEASSVHGFSSFPIPWEPSRCCGLHKREMELQGMTDNATEEGDSES